MAYIAPFVGWNSTNTTNKPSNSSLVLSSSSWLSKPRVLNAFHARARVSNKVVIKASAHDKEEEKTQEKEEKANWEQEQKRKEDLNILQTQLRMALKAEDYKLAAEIRDQIKSKIGSNQDMREFVDWRAFGAPSWLSDRLEKLGFELPLQIQRQTMQASVEQDREVAILSQTGSGKSLGYMVPLLTKLSDALFDASIEYKPVDAPTNRFPQVAMIIVPSAELASTTALLLYQLLGGDLRKDHEPGSKLNMYQYQGPRGIRVMGVFDHSSEQRAIEGDLLDGVHIVIGTPTSLAKVVKSLVIIPKQLKAIVVDEFDKCLQLDADAMKILLSESPYHMFAGASITAEQIRKAILLGWLKNPLLVTETNIYEDPDAIQGIRRLPPGLSHRYVCVDGWRALGTLSAIMREDMAMFRLKMPEESPRVVVFAPNEEIARGSAEKLRNVMWNKGGAKIAVLLPQSGVIPFKVMEWFRDNVVNILIMTPESSRGLDFPQVSHVYNLYLPITIEDYLHQAGRCGRVGQSVPGVVTSLISELDEGHMKNVASLLQTPIERLEAPEAALPDSTNKESTVDFLETLFYLSPKEGEEGDSARGGQK
eukprot:CAMPEP_0184693410 /NCGR_PEP_ID=MMETSP0313-20130426/1641_1 /TAXON_ID=2792 /ORGANISM="Porphyridium aerugineum, Strain SAG 1380-2" /LENGTH=592 /DNA_ID=CAMNT_0027151485 /DNA_START=158 /DNA_END=1936 /DNA_ORIENTATION=-